MPVQNAVEAVTLTWNSQSYRRVGARLSGALRVVSCIAVPLTDRLAGGQAICSCIAALGISDAFRDAQLLSEAIDAGLAGRLPLAEALAGYQQRRDEAATAMYELTC